MRQGGALRKAAIAAALAGTLVLMLPAHAANRTVEARGLTFVPPVVLAGGGDTITLVNREPINIPFLAHTFTTTAAICQGTDANGNLISVPCDTGVVLPGNSATVALNNAAPGIYVFYCLIHSLVVGGQRVGMVGRLRIG